MSVFLSLFSLSLKSINIPWQWGIFAKGRNRKLFPDATMKAFAFHSAKSIFEFSKIHYCSKQATLTAKMNSFFFQICFSLIQILQVVSVTPTLPLFFPRPLERVETSSYMSLLTFFLPFGSSAAANQYLKFYVGEATTCQNVHISYMKRTGLMNMRFEGEIKDQGFLLKLQHRKIG